MVEGQVASLLASMSRLPSGDFDAKISGFYRKSLSCSKNRFKICRNSWMSCLKPSS